MADPPLTKSLRCESCGAPLEAPAGRTVVQCAACGHEQELAGGARGREEDAALTERLMGGFDNEVGQGARHGLSEMAQRDWRAVERGVWPIDGSASTSLSQGYGAASVIGRPRVYPLRGDKKGSWSPSKATSSFEWIEAVYAADAPKVSQIRVFETNHAGATYAVTVRDRPGGPQELLWQAPVDLRYRSESLVLEVEVDPPRRLHAVRAYVDNTDATWTAIDTIGLVAAEPLPPAMRTAWPKQRWRVPWPVTVVVVLLLCIWGLGRWCDSQAEPAAQPSTHQHVGASERPVRAPSEDAGAR